MPFCSETRCAVSSPRLSSASASRSSACARSSTDHDDHPPGSSNAARAALTAASMSAFVPSGTDPTSSSVLAAITDMRSEPCGSIQSPPMKSSSLSMVVCVLIGCSPCIRDMRLLDQTAGPAYSACSFRVRRRSRRKRREQAYPPIRLARYRKTIVDSAVRGSRTRPLSPREARVSPAPAETLAARPRRASAGV